MLHYIVEDRRQKNRFFLPGHFLGQKGDANVYSSSYEQTKLNCTYAEHEVKPTKVFVEISTRAPSLTYLSVVLYFAVEGDIFDNTGTVDKPCPTTMRLRRYQNVRRAKG